MLGRAHGVGPVLRALRESEAELTVILAAAQYAAPGAPERGHGSDAAVAEVRQSLEALSGDDVALSRAMSRPLGSDRFGRRPLGNLLLRSLASAFGDLGAASSWLGTQLGIAGSVLPATVEPLKFTIERGALSPSEPVTGSGHALDRLRLIPDHPDVSSGVVSAIRRVGLVLLAPGSLFTSVLVAGAIPDVRDALRVTRAPVIWICNLEPEREETANEQLATLRRHDIRVDAVLYDPRARLRLEAGPLHEQGVAAIGRQLMGVRAGAHDPHLLRCALAELPSALHRHG